MKPDTNFQVYPSTAKREKDLKVYCLDLSNIYNTRWTTRSCQNVNKPHKNTRGSELSGKQTHFLYHVCSYLEETLLSVDISLFHIFSLQIIIREWHRPCNGGRNSRYIEARANQNLLFRLPLRVVTWAMYIYIHVHNKSLDKYKEKVIECTKVKMKMHIKSFIDTRQPRSSLCESLLNLHLKFSHMTQVDGFNKYLAIYVITF